MRRLLALLTLGCVLFPAQRGRAQSGGPGNIAGTLYASNFAGWTVPKGNNGPFAWSSSSTCTSATSGGVTFRPFTVGVPIRIVDTGSPLLSETVTPTQVSITGSGCSITVTPANQHYSFYLTTATAGLVEAIQSALAISQPAVVIVTPAWSTAGGMTSMITTAAGSSAVTVLDERTSVIVPYTWSGSAYVAQPFASGGSIAPCAQYCAPYYSAPVSGSNIAGAGVNGIAVYTPSAPPAAALFGNVVSLFGGGTCSGYLKSDGTCSIPVQVTLQNAGVNSASQNLLNFIASTANVTGLTVMPSNPAGGTEKYEITGTTNATSGGTGLDTHSSTGCPSIATGTWSVGTCPTTTLPASPSGSIQYNNGGAFGGSSNAVADSAGNVNLLGMLGVGLSQANTSHLLDSSGANSSTTLTGANPVELRVANTDQTASNYEGMAVAMTNSSAAVVTAGKITWVNTSHTAASESADLHFLNRNAGTVADQWQMLHTGGMTSTGVTGGDKGAGTINMAGCYVSNVACATGGSLPAATAPGQIITSTAAGTTYAIQSNIFYQQSGDTIASIESECSSPCTYVVTSPQTITLSGSHALATNVYLYFQANGLWTINGAFTFTFAPGQIQGTLNQHFAGTSTLAGGTGSVPLEWFGVVGYNTRFGAASGLDYTTQIQKCLNFITNGGWCQGQNLYYQTSSGLVITTSNVGLHGVQGRDSYFSSAHPTSFISTATSGTILDAHGTSGTYIQWNNFADFAVERVAQCTSTTATDCIGISSQYIGGEVLENIASTESLDDFYFNADPYEDYGHGWNITCSNGVLIDTYTNSQPINCFDIDSSNGVPMASTWFQNINFAPKNSAKTPLSKGFYIHGTAINDINVYGFAIDSAAYGVDVEYTGSGVAVDHCADLHFNFPNIDGVSVSAFKINGLSNLCNGSLNILGGYADGGVSNQKLIDIESSFGVNVQDLQLFDMSGGSAITAIYANGSTALNFTGNHFNFLPGGTGILFVGTTASVGADNQFYGEASIGIMATGISMTSTSTGNSITGNMVSNYAVTGYSFDGTSAANEFAGNACGSVGLTTCVSGSPAGISTAVTATDNIVLSQLNSSANCMTNNPSSGAGKAPVYLCNIVGAQGLFSSNAVYNGTNWVRTNAGAASAGRALGGGTHAGFQISVSETGSAGSTISGEDTTDVALKCDSSATIPQCFFNPTTAAPTYGTVAALTINPYRTVDNAANVQITTTATGAKALVLQGTSGQTAHVFEVQDNTGAVKASVTMAGLAAIATGSTVNGSLICTAAGVAGCPVGTVTSIATTGPITGGTITGAGTIACPTCGVTGSPLSQFAATTSAQLAGVLSDETGTGVAVFSASPVFTGIPQVPTAALGTNSTQAASTQFVLATMQGSAATWTDGGSGTTVTCADASSAAVTCTSGRGSLKIVGNTATTGTIATATWTAEPSARVCVVTQNGNGSTGTSSFDLGHTAPAITGISITAGLTVLGATIFVDYECGL